MPLYYSLTDLREAAHALLLANRKVGTERLTGQPYAYVCPSRTTYPYQWLWDSCFHAIALCDLGQSFPPKGVGHLLLGRLVCRDLGVQRLLNVLQLLNIRRRFAHASRARSAFESILSFTVPSCSRTVPI